MKTSSAKAKGRSVAKLFKAFLLEKTDLCSEDINITSSGVTGEDVTLSSYARTKWPYSTECKARSRISVYEWLEQASKHNPLYPPIVIAKGDRKDPIVIMYLKDFLNDY